MDIICGKLFDADFLYPMMIGASLLYVVSYYMLSLTHEGQFYQVFLAQGIGAGISLGFHFLPAIGVIAHHFRRRRSFAMGIIVSGSSCGGIVFPVMLNKIIERNGFAAATRAVSYLGTILIVLAVLSMRTRLPMRSKMAITPGAAPPPAPDVVGMITDWKYMCAIGG
jgi:MFS transporter, MCT family, solute carrier family 16 (monocarboxylic acid transporters), member 10